MVLQNYVVLQTGRPSRLHFASHDLMPRTIADSVTLRPKSVNTLVFQVDELDGRPVSSQYSVLSEKHARDFAPYLVGERYRSYDFIVTVQGEGFRREYQVQVLPRR